MSELKKFYGIYDEINPAVKALEVKLQERGLQMHQFDLTMQIPDTPVLVCLTKSFEGDQKLLDAYSNAMTQHVQDGRGKILACILEQGTQVPPLLASRAPVALYSDETISEQKIGSLANAIKGIRPGPPALGGLKLPNP